MWEKNFVMGILIILIGAVIASGCTEKGEFTSSPTNIQTGEANLIIENVSAKYDEMGSTLDKIRINFENIKIRNIGNGSFCSALNSQTIIFETVVKGQHKTIKDYACIKPNETWSPALADIADLSINVERQPKEYEFEGVLYIKNEYGKILNKRNFSVSIPTAKIGDTILIHMRDGRKFDLTLNSWHIEPDKWDADKMDVVINVTVKNSYSRTEESAPTLNGVIMTDKGYVLGYQTSHFYCPTNDNPYRSCPSSLLPEESFTGELRIEGIPKDWKPVELSIFCLYGDVDEIIILSD